MEQLFTIKTAAKLLDVSEQYLKRLQRRGQLRVIHLGRAVRIRERELERLCQDGVGPTGPKTPGPPSAPRAGR